MTRTLLTNLGLLILIILCGIQVVISIEAVLQAPPSFSSDPTPALINGGLGWLASLVGFYAFDNLRKKKIHTRNIGEWLSQ